MRIQIAIIGLLTAVLLGGCSYFGGGAKHTLAAPAANFDILKMQRAQWRRLAEQGDAEGEYQLGMTYCCGFGPGHTDTIAYKWLCRAALQGHEQAQFQLGRMFGYGIKKRPFSTPQVADVAYMWYGLAAAQGDQVAAGYKTALEQSMSAQQIARARAWEKHPATAVNCDSRLPFARL
jgi:TPR repeat protein